MRDVRPSHPRTIRSRSGAALFGFPPARPEPCVPPSAERLRKSTRAFSGLPLDHSLATSPPRALVIICHRAQAISSSRGNESGIEDQRDRGMAPQQPRSARPAFRLGVELVSVQPPVMRSSVSVRGRRARRGGCSDRKDERAGGGHGRGALMAAALKEVATPNRRVARRRGRRVLSSVTSGRAPRSDHRHRGTNPPRESTYRSTTVPLPLHIPGYERLDHPSRSDS